MDLQSLLGYAYGSPFSSSPYLDIQTPEGTITMENTPIDLLGIDNLGNVKKMKAGRKNPYKFKGNKVREIPLQQGGRPTRQDSLDLYNNSRKVLDYYKNYQGMDKPEILMDFQIPTPEGYDHILDVYRDNYKKGIEVTYPTQGGKKTQGLLPEHHFRKDVDPNRFYQRESQFSILDTRSPMQLYDRRIGPTLAYKLYNNQKDDIMRNDMVDVLTYDPIAVKPVDMLTPEERVLREKRYGPIEQSRPTTPSPKKVTPRYIPQERNLPNTDVTGIDMTTLGAIPTPTRTTDVTPHRTNYSVTVRDENAPSKQRVIYFNSRDEWRNFLDSGVVSPISTQERANSGSAATYRTMKKGGKTKKKQPRGNPYQKGGYTPKQLFDFIFDDDVEEPVKNQIPVAPTTEEVDLQVAINDAEALRRQSSNMENDQMAMDLLSDETRNPYRRDMIMGDIRSSGQFGAQNIGQMGRQIYSQLATDLGYAPVANSIYRSKEQNDALIAAGAPAAKNSWHLTGNAIDLKPTDWHRLSDEQQSFYKANYDVVYHNNHYHIEPK